MHEEWCQILQFPGYSVSSTGRVQNEKTGRILKKHVNQHGIVNVSLHRRGDEFRRSVSVLVATAFVRTARSKTFDTPINLDGNRLNNRADNLLWRPRWYAREYFGQFNCELNGIEQPVQEHKTGEVFKCSWEAAVTFGLLDREVVRSVIHMTYALPTYQLFHLYE
jgi:NUMOD4 motif